MYLLVRDDCSVKQTHDNLTTSDYLAVQQNSLRVFRVNTSKATFEGLVFDQGKACWVPVKEAGVLAAPGIHLHH